MALKDKLFDFIDNATLSKIFSRKQPDPKLLRAPLIKGIANAKRQYESGVTKAPNRWWKLNNDVVALTVKVAGDTFDINGVATNHMPADRFTEFLDEFKAAVEAGEFDEELRHKGNGDAKVVIPKASGRGAISPEAAKARGAKAAESRARNRSAVTTNKVGAEIGIQTAEKADVITPKPAPRGAISAEAAKARGVKAAASRARNRVAKAAGS